MCLKLFRPTNENFKITFLASETHYRILFEFYKIWRSREINSQNRIDLPCDIFIFAI